MTFLVVAETFVPTGSVPGPFYLANRLRQWIGRTKRYSQIMRILQRRGLLPYLRGSRRSELRTSDGRARLARSVRLALEDGGVTFVKLGQVLATRRDLLPDEFVQELSALQDDAAPVSWPEIDEVIKAELGVGVDELFVAFERTLLAAASIAQVHVGKLRSGQRVVVKVCRPEAPAVVESDLAILDSLAARPDRSWGRSVGAIDLAHGFGDALREELDLRIEARNMTSVAAASAARGGSSVRSRFAADYLAEQFRPDSLKTAAIDELTSLLPILRRLPSRIDRMSEALETGRLSVNMRLLGDDGDRRYVTGLVHQILLAFLAAASGIMAVLVLVVHGRPSITTAVTVYQFVGYCLLVSPPSSHFGCW